MVVLGGVDEISRHEGDHENRHTDFSLPLWAKEIRPQGLGESLKKVGIGITDVKLDGNDVVFSSFIPVEQLFRETLQELDQGGGHPDACLQCREYFDVETEDGIFADPQQLSGFVCRGCAETMSAWTFFQEHLKT